MGRGRIAIFLAILLLISGCAGGGPKCPVCPEPSTYSQCSDDAVKTRTNYRCDESTNFECVSYIEEKQCKTELSLAGNIDVIVKPTIEERVKGIIKLEISGVPEDAQLVVFYLAGGDLPPISNERRPTPATNQGDVWTGMIDTNDYENGLYDIAVVGTNQVSLEGNPQYYAMGQVLVDN